MFYIVLLVYLEETRLEIYQSLECGFGLFYLNTKHLTYSKPEEKNNNNALKYKI